MEQRSPIVHNLKVWPEYFCHLRSGDKTFEIRKNDRDYRAGDYLRLSEWDPATEKYTGEVIVFDVPYVLYGPLFGLKEGYCVMSLKPSKWKFKLAEEV